MGVEKVVIIVVTAWCPHLKGDELGKKFIEVVSKHPIQSYEKVLVAGASRPVKGGKNKFIHVVACKAEKYNETLKNTYNRFQFYAEIEGFEYEIESMVSARRGLEWQGAQMPG